MLTYTPPADSAAPAATERPWLLLLLAFAWLWPGVFAHDLWLPEEPMLFALVAQWQQGHGPLPTLFGEPQWGSSPLYVWLGALSQRWLAPGLLDAYEAVRLVNVLLTSIGLACIGGAAREFLGPRHGRSAVLLVLGCPGLLLPAHLIHAVPVLFAGSALCVYGWSLVPRRVIMASLMLGGGWVVLALSGSLLPALLLMLVAGLLMAWRSWQTPRYRLVLVIALLWAWPQLLLWPYALYRSDPALLALWWQQHWLAPLGGAAGLSWSFSLGYYLKNLLWYAFPAWPLAWWSASRMRVHAQAWGVLVWVWLGLLLLLLALMPERRHDWLVLLLPPLAVLGSAKLDALRRGAAAFLNWFGIMTFGLLALFLWLGFAAMNYGWPAKLAERAAYFSPYYQSDVDYFPLLVACVFTPLWLWAITRKHVRGRQAVTNWAAGMTLVWSLLLTLFLPWLDAAKSLRPVVQQMQNRLDAPRVAALQSAQDCVSVDARLYQARIAWQQYGWVVLEPDRADCRYRLVSRPLHANQAEAGWQEIWSGARPREKSRVFALWQRQEPDTPSSPSLSESP